MDYNYIENILRKDIKNTCPQLPNEIVEEYIDFTFFRSSWVIYGNNKNLYIVGIAEGKHDFYYIGFDDDLKVELISCALQITRNKDRDNYFISKVNDDLQKWWEEDNRIWEIIRNNIKEYFKNNKQYKLIYFQDHILSDEHIVYDNEEHTEYHIEKI